MFVLLHGGATVDHAVRTVAIIFVSGVNAEEQNADDKQEYKGERNVHLICLLTNATDGFATTRSIEFIGFKFRQDVSDFLFRY